MAPVNVYMVHGRNMIGRSLSYTDLLPGQGQVESESRAMTVGGDLWGDWRLYISGSVGNVAHLGGRMGR